MSEYLRHEGATATPLAVPALAPGGECGSGVALVTGPGQIAIAYQPRGVALDTGDLKGGAHRGADLAGRGHERMSPAGRGHGGAADFGWQV